MATSAGAVYVDVRANTNPFEKSMVGLGAVAGRIGKLLAGALSVAALAKFGSSCVSLASDLAEVQNVVDVTFSHMNGRMNEWAASAAQNFGLSETMAKRYAGSFGSMAEAFGFTEQQAYDMSTALTGLAGDVASFYNISQDLAYTKLKSVFSGETESLKELGIVMTQSALDQYALANGYGKTTKAMTEQEKVSLRLAFVQHALTNASGDFARTSGSWANQTRLLALNFEQLKATIGQSLIAALLPAVRLLNAIVLAATNAARAFNRFVEAVTGKSMGVLMGGTEQVAVNLGDMGATANAASGSLGDLGAAQTKAAKAAKAQDKAQRALNRTLAGFDKINKLASGTDSSTPQTAGGSGGVDSLGAGAVTGALSDIADSADQTQSALSKLHLPDSLLSAMERLKSAFSHLSESVAAIGSDFYEKFLKPFSEFAANTILPDVVNLIADGLEHVAGFLDKIRDPASRLFELAESFCEFAWTEALQPLLDFATNEVMPRVLDGIGTAFDIIVTCMEKLQPVAKWLWDNIVSPLAGAVGQLLLDVLDGINNFLTWIDETIQEADFSDFVDFLDDVKNAFGYVADSYKRDWEAAWSGISESLGSIAEKWDGLKEGTKSLLVKAEAEVSDKWESVKSVFADAGGWLADKSASVTATVSATVSDKWEAAKGAFKWVKDNAKAFVTAKAAKISATVKATVARAWDKAKDAFSFAKKKGLALGKKLSSGNLTATVKALFEGSRVWGSVKKAFTWVMENKDKFKNRAAKIAATVKTAMGTGWDKVKDLWNWATKRGTAFRNAAAYISATVYTFASRAFQQVKEAFNWAKNNLKDRIATIGLQLQGMNVKAVINNIIAWVNSRLNGLRWPTFTVAGKTYGGGNIFPWNPVPYLAQGGYVARNTPRLAVIGDNRREGEIVSPESKLQAMADRAASSGNVSELMPVLNAILQAVQSIDPNTYIDGRAVTRTVVRTINQQTRATGVSPLVV